MPTENAQQTLKRLSTRAIGVTIKELAKERGASSIGPLQRTIDKGIKDKIVRATQETRDGYAVIRTPAAFHKHYKVTELLNVKTPDPDPAPRKDTSFEKQTDFSWPKAKKGVADPLAAIAKRLASKKTSNQNIAGILRLLADLLEE